ncbi:MAG TPA: hypothetical protein VN517_17330 [Terriglobales bacterium]|jgi:hypothetical protein|nr:hypothetical protein [Terriglobales bacterium]
MNNVRVRTMQILVIAVTIALSTPGLLAQAKRPPSKASVQAQQQNSTETQTTPVAAQTSLCANRPLCYEGNDFVATVTEFRTSTDPRGIRIIDAMMHFQNKTNQQISLGYVDGSGSAIDDMGNRLALNAYNGGVRGMGIVAGNNVDPKFSLPPGGGGDTRFELYWMPGGKLSGVNYEMELSIREMNRVEGNQWTLGDETLLHYQGLANGMGVAPLSNVNSAGMGSAGMSSGTGATSTVGSTVNAFTPGQANASVPSAQPMMAASGQPCPPGARTSGTLTNVANTAGAQNDTANNAVTNASAAISNLGSIFGRKKKPAAAATTANAAAPCSPAVNANTKANTMGTTVANTATTQPASVVPAANTNAAVQPRSAVSRRAVANTATQPTTAAVVTKTSMKQPLPATRKTAAPAAKKPAQAPATTINGTGAAK